MPVARAFKQPNTLPVPWKGKTAYMLAEQWEFWIGDWRVVVDPGVIVDLASVPRVLWWLFPPDGLYRAAVFAHDIIYGLKGKVPSTVPDGTVIREVSRVQADHTMLVYMINAGVPKKDRDLMHDGVSYFGWYAWWKSDGKLDRYEMT
jgi:hypothetical protein